MLSAARAQGLGTVFLGVLSICPLWAQDRAAMGVPVEIENDRRQPVVDVRVEYAIAGGGTFVARAQRGAAPRVDVRAGQGVTFQLEHPAFGTRSVPLKIPAGIVGIRIMIGSSATTAVAVVARPEPRGPWVRPVNAGGTPANDECLGMIEIPCNGSVVADNSTATTAADDPAFSCRLGGAGQGVNSIWYSFVATETRAIVDTEGSVAPADDSLLAVYDGACGSLVELGCSDDDGTGFLSSVTVDGLVVGQTYILQLASFSADDVGAYMLNVACVTPPEVELCFGIEEFEAEEDELELCAAFDAGEDFDPREEDLTINIIDGEDGDVFAFEVPGDAFEEDDDDEFEAEIETDEFELEIEFDLDDCELELEIEGEDDEEPFEDLDGPTVTIELVFSSSGSVSETFVAEQDDDDDELEFEAEDEPDCCEKSLLTTEVGGPPRFDIDSERVLLGDPVSFEASGTPGAPVQIVLVEADGIPASLPVTAGLFDASGRFTLHSRTVRDPALDGLELSFVARTVGPQGELLESDRERLRLRFSRRSFPARR